MTDRAALLRFADGAGACAAVDWLQEQGAALADVLRAYAGAPAPDPLCDWLGATHAEDEGLRRVVARWCEATEPDRRCSIPSAIRFAAVRECGLDWEAELRQLGFELSWPEGGIPPKRRGEFCRQLMEDLSWSGDGIPSERRGEFCRQLMEAGDKDRVATVPAEATWMMDMLRHAAARARRAQKRAVLALFADVEADAGSLVADGRLRYGKQQVPAPEWVPPEPPVLEDLRGAWAEGRSPPPDALVEDIVLVRLRREFDTVVADPRIVIPPSD